MLGLKELSRLWSLGFLLLLAALVLAFVLMRRHQGGTATVAAAGPTAKAQAGASATPTWTDRLGWIGLALVPAALLTAFTTHVTTDIASAPLLWVLPLSLYLLTFVLVFRDKPLIPRQVLLFAASGGRGGGAVGAGADQARQLVRHRHDRRHRVLHLGHGGAPHALRGAPGGQPPDRVLPVDVVRRGARRLVGGADRAQDLQRGVRVSAAARPVDGLPSRRLQRRRPAARRGQHRHRVLAPAAAAPPSSHSRNERGRQAGGAGAVADRRRRHPRDLLAALGDRQAPAQSGRMGQHGDRGGRADGGAGRRVPPTAAPVRGGPPGVLRAHLAALRRQARRGPAQLLRRLSRADLERRRLSHPRARHDAARRAARAERGGQAGRRSDARHLLLREQPDRADRCQGARAAGRAKGALRRHRARRRVARLPCQGGRGVALLRDRSGSRRHRQATRAISPS